MGWTRAGRLEPLEELPLAEGSEVTARVPVPDEKEATARPNLVIPTWNVGLGTRLLTREDANDDCSRSRVNCWRDSTHEVRLRSTPDQWTRGPPDSGCDVRDDRSSALRRVSGNHAVRERRASVARLAMQRPGASVKQPCSKQGAKACYA